MRQLPLCWDGAEGEGSGKLGSGRSGEHLVFGR